MRRVVLREGIYEKAESLRISDWIGVGIVVAAFLRAYEHSRKKAVAVVR